jgi:hypothetical protein
MSDLASMLEKVRSAQGADSDLDRELVNSLGFHAWAGRMSYRDPPKWVDFGSSAVTGSIDAALALAERTLPGWMYRLASCSVSDDAWVCPDFNHPTYGAALMSRYGGAFGGRDPAEAIIEATDVDRRPAGQPALALIEAILLGIIITQETPNGN